MKYIIAIVYVSAIFLSSCATQNQPIDYRTQYLENGRIISK